MTLTTPTPIGSGSVPVGEARAAGAKARSVRASVRVRATFLNMEFLLRSADLRCQGGYGTGPGFPFIYPARGLYATGEFCSLAICLLSWAMEANSSVNPFAYLARMDVAYPPREGRALYFAFIVTASRR
jgi:hypothetical protein